MLSMRNTSYYAYYGRYYAARAGPHRTVCGQSACRSTPGCVFRDDKKGTVFIQTLYPDNAVLKALINNDREQFLKIEKKREIL